MDVVATEEHGELVAAEAGHHRLLALEFAEALADHLQQPVADVVPQGVVDILEPVDVHEQHGCRPGHGQPSLEPLLEVQPVRQPGEGVVQREVLGLPSGRTNLFQQGGVRERDGRMCGQRLEEPRVLEVEGADLVQPVRHDEQGHDVAALSQGRRECILMALGSQRVVRRPGPAAGEPDELAPASPGEPRGLL